MQSCRSPKTQSRFALVAAVFMAFSICVGCGDVYRPVAVPIRPVPPIPAASHVAIALTGNSANGVTYRGVAMTIDVSGDTDEGQSTLGLQPVHAAMLPNGLRFYAADKLDDTVTSAAPAGANTVTTVLAPGSAPVFLNTTQNGVIYVAESGTAKVGVINAASNVVTNEVAVGTTPVGLAEMPNAMKVYVAGQSNGTLPAAVLSVNTIDYTANAPIAASTWISPTWVVARSDNYRVYVLDTGAGTVSAIDTFTETIVGSVSVGVGANFLVYEGGLNRLYVVNPVSGNVYALDATSDKLPTLFTVPVASPLSVAALPDGSRIYISSATVSGSNVSSQVTVVYAANGVIKQTIPLVTTALLCATGASSELFTVASVDSTRVFVGNCDAGNVADIATVPGTSPVDSYPEDTLLLTLPAPFSAQTPANGGTPAPQNPVFVLAGP
jgi:YVTN family beta-propeller protein